MYSAGKGNSQCLSHGVSILVEERDERQRCQVNAAKRKNEAECMCVHGLPELGWAGKQAARQYAFLQGTHFTLKRRNMFWSHKELGSRLDSVT